MRTNMSDKHNPNKIELVLSRNNSLAITRSDLVKRGLALIDEVKKREGWPPRDLENKEIEEGRFVSIDEVRETGGGIFKDDEKKEMDKLLFEIINEIQKTGRRLLTENEKKAIGNIIYDTEIHFLIGTNIFSSRADFNTFLNTEVKYYAKSFKVDFEMAKEAYIFWAKKFHSAEYDQLSQMKI